MLGFDPRTSASRTQRSTRLSYTPVGVAGFEPATSCTPCRRATRLRYTPSQGTLWWTCGESNPVRPNLNPSRSERRSPVAQPPGSYGSARTPGVKLSSTFEEAPTRGSGPHPSPGTTGAWATASVADCGAGPERTVYATASSWRNSMSMFAFVDLPTGICRRSSASPGSLQGPPFVRRNRFRPIVRDAGVEPATSWV